MKLFLFGIALITLIVSCGNGKSNDKTEGKSAWTEERKNKEIADCITSMIFKKENDSLPEATKKAVCDCSVNRKMARYPDEKNANINMAAELGIGNMQTFRDSCIGEIVK